MINLILAAGILASIPAAIDRTQEVDDFPRLTKLEGRVLVLEAGRVADRAETQERGKCLKRSLIGAGADLYSTGWALARCPNCREANPLGLNVESRVGLKTLEIGAAVGACYVAPTNKAAKAFSWVSLAAQLVFGANNAYHAIRGQ